MSQQFDQRPAAKEPRCVTRRLWGELEEVAFGKESNFLRPPVDLGEAGGDVQILSPAKSGGTQEIHAGDVGGGKLLRRCIEKLLKRLGLKNRRNISH